MTENNVVGTGRTPEQSALALEAELDRAISEFVFAQGPLLRAACTPPEGTELENVAVSVFFGHTLRRMLERIGKPTLEKLLAVQIAALDLIASRKGKERTEFDFDDSVEKIDGALREVSFRLCPHCSSACRGMERTCGADACVTAHIDQQIARGTPT